MNIPQQNGRSAVAIKKNSLLIPVMALFSTLFIQFLSALVLLTAPILAPIAANSIGTQAAKIGIYIGIIYSMATISSLFSGYLVERYGAIRTAQFSLFLCVAGLLFALMG